VRRSRHATWQTLVEGRAAAAKALHRRGVNKTVDVPARLCGLFAALAAKAVSSTTPGFKRFLGARGAAPERHAWRVALEATWYAWRASYERADTR
jgi:hypothetical protein